MGTGSVKNSEVSILMKATEGAAMQKRVRTRGCDPKGTEVAIIIPNIDADTQQLEQLKALAESLAPQFLAKVGAPGDKFKVIVKTQHH
jgi:hypothetical protein